MSLMCGCVGLVSGVCQYETLETWTFFHPKLKEDRGFLTSNNRKRVISDRNCGH